LARNSTDRAATATRGRIVLRVDAALPRVQLGQLGDDAVEGEQIDGSLLLRGDHVAEGDLRPVTAAGDGRSSQTAG
jgi:hypothetical protein